MQIPPSTALSGFIRHYLFLDVEGNYMHKLRLFSDGSSGIVLGPNRTLFMDSSALPGSFCYGQITEYKELFCKGPAKLLIIVFHPQFLNRILHIPASELNNKVIPLTDLFGGVGVALQGAAASADNLSVKIAHVDFLIQKIIANYYLESDPIVNAALHVIQQRHGLLTIRQLGDIVGCQPRQLERKFDTAVGLGPKHFSNIVRILSFVKSLQHIAPKQNFTRFAYDSGYYDQAHCIRECRKMTGLTPSQYARHPSPLAVNLVEL